MKILRDERTVALGEVIVACHQVAEVCKTAADAAGNEAVANALHELAENRERVAHELHREAERQLGETPADSVPEERTLFEKAATRLTGLVDEPGLLDRCRDKEDAVAATAEAALRLLPAGDIRERLVALRGDCARRIGAIIEMDRGGGEASDRENEGPQ